MTHLDERRPSRSFAVRDLSLSIRAKLAAGCVLIIVTVGLLGAFMEVSQQRVGLLGTEIYDRAFLAMSYLRSSQNGLAKLLADTEHIAREDQQHAAGASPLAGIPGHAAAAWVALAAKSIPDILSDVQIARERALSPEGAASTDRLAARLRILIGAVEDRDVEAVALDIQALQRDFDTAVEIYAGDGYHSRKSMQMLIDRSLRNTLVAIGIAVATTVAIAALVGRSIIPALRKAVAVARFISDGKLDNEITVRGSDEAATLLRALGTMQASLAQKIARIDALAAESSERAAQFSIQSGRFEAALDNIQQGLRMYDADGRLVVTNRRYAEMFDTSGGGPPAAVEDLAWTLSTDNGDTASPMTRLDDGRVITSSRRPIRGGGWVSTYEDVTDRHEAESKLRYMARHDALTGLPNRVLFRERVEQLISHVASNGGPTVLCVDLDGFKHVNDTHGHLIGDDLLRAMAIRLRDGLQVTEMIARLGGDEFAVVLASGDPARAEACAHSLVRMAAQPFVIAGHRIAISASVGIATRGSAAACDTGDLFTVLLRNADIALYLAKAEGRNCYRFYSPVLQAAAENKRQMEADLARAIEQRELFLVFQPLVEAVTRKVQGFEALLRWHHATHGVVSPADFIPLAEETGAILAIGQWVLASACAEATRWPPDIRVAVNVSPTQLRQAGLGLTVMRVLAETGLDPSRLELEITESTLLQDEEAVLATLSQLRAIGVRIALDDFGTGYSALSYLHRFPFDKVKVDKSFIKDLSTPTNAAILKAVVTLGRSLDLVVVAEGVETQQQADRLTADGCTQLQGFLFGRPEPAADVPRVLNHLNDLTVTDVRHAS